MTGRECRGRLNVIVRECLQVQYVPAERRTRRTQPTRKPEYDGFQLGLAQDNLELGILHPLVHVSVRFGVNKYTCTHSQAPALVAYVRGSSGVVAGDGEGGGRGPIVLNGTDDRALGCV